MKEQIFASYKDWVANQEMPNGKRSAILSALELFSKQGYDGTSTMAIAKHAGISQATIFKYFKTKQDLLKEILRPIVQNLLPSYKMEFLDSLPDKPTLKENVAFLVRDRYRFLEANSDVIMIFLSQVLTGGDIKDLFVGFITESEKDFVNNIFDRLKRTGEMSASVTPLVMLRTIGGQLLTYFLQTHKIAPQLPVDKEADLNLIIELVTKTLAAE